VPGDVVKAFGGGADFVMLGGMLAGHTESGGELVEKDGKQYKLFYGRSSETAMNKYAGGVADYRASEGKTTHIKYRGPVAETLQDILGGLRSACTYVGARALKELSKRTTFIRVNEQHNEWFGE
jgi:GMP reductase